MERTKDRIVDQIVDVPVPPVMEEIASAVQEAARLVPKEHGQRIDKQALQLRYGRGCRRVQNGTTGAIVGKDL